MQISFNFAAFYKLNFLSNVFLDIVNVGVSVAARLDFQRRLTEFLVISFQYIIIT